jgi:hypothetical protein
MAGELGCCVCADCGDSVTVMNVIKAGDNPVKCTACIKRDFNAVRSHRAEKKRAMREGYVKFLVERKILTAVARERIFLRH